MYSQNNLPIFLHIPKNCGTYILSCMMSALRWTGIINGHDKQCSNEEWRLKFRRLLVKENNKIILTVFIYDNNEIHKTDSSFIKDTGNVFVDSISLSNFLVILTLKKIQLFSVMIESEGMKYYRESLIENISKILNRNLTYFTVLREPFSRAYSMYTYLQGDQSTHEPTHNAINSITFYDYLKSSQLEDSWLIRELVGIDVTQELNEDMFVNACEVLDTFKITDVNNIDSLFNNIFKEVYDFEFINIPDTHKFINSNKTDVTIKITFNLLNEELKQTFQERTKFDEMLYSKYCNNK